MVSFSVPVAGMYVYRAVKQVGFWDGVVVLGHTEMGVNKGRLSQESWGFNGDSIGIAATEYDMMAVSKMT